VLVNFEFTQSTPRHTPTSSWDSKMPTPESPVCVPRGHFKHLTLTATRTPDLKITHCSTEPDEISDLETLKEDLIRENERIRNQENSFRVIFEKLKQETQAVKREKDELKTRKEELRMKEESIIQQKVDMEEERVALDNEKKFVWNLRQSLDQEFLYLKNEQLRVRVKKIYKKKIKEILERNQLRMQKQIELRVNIEEFN
jgi:DNA repair exonuclease SbcCD ATPase subunit